MKNYCLVTISVACMFLSAYGAPLTPDQALERIESSGIKKVRRVKNSPEFRNTYFDREGTPAIYHFTYSGSEGFMLLSADDAGAPVLGYSETGVFSVEQGSPAVASWLADYAAGLAEGRKRGAVYSKTATRADELGDPIAPQIKSKWDQMYPYNYMCPILDKRTCVTGCVATAMAQVMNYWQYPASGTGLVSYYCYPLKENLSLDLSTISFDWNLMRDTYGYNVAATYAKAVGDLMKACGYSVNTQYSPDGSSAYAQSVVTAMKTNFKYDQGLKMASRNDYNIDSWNRLMYNNLLNVGPVIYGASSVDNGHCFICDGYDADGFFHINWGWSGVSDGYYLLDALSPQSQGTGGGTGTYNRGQTIYLGIRPPQGRLFVNELMIANYAADSGLMQGQGYVFRINDYRNIQLSLNARATGGNLSAPINVKIYERDPVADKNVGLRYETTLVEKVDLMDGAEQTYTGTVDFKDFDPSKLYYLTVSYPLNGETNILGSILFAASSVVEGVAYDDISVNVLDNRVDMAGEGRLEAYDIEGRLIGSVQGVDPVLSLVGQSQGIYIVRAVSGGEVRTFKLLLK